MKIGSLENKPVVPAPATERKGNPAPGAAAAEPSAKVALSPAASLLAGAAGDPTFDVEKVQRIAGAIRDGRFQVNAEAIADKLVANAEELLGRKLS
ncbi:MAG TPA: flagellar biosynthesis anti-sigma factor FlgM [Rubrivivax sp.]|nr:flagellar biosynthesis anti-sigma factor FlgM [Pseudomonadota bacterium]HPP84171.1 flagellar biosynthesis anti-sigma factor FlgM [Rubrivivax sp.]